MLPITYFAHLGNVCSCITQSLNQYIRIVKQHILCYFVRDQMLYFLPQGAKSWLWVTHVASGFAWKWSANPTIVWNVSYIAARWSGSCCELVHWQVNCVMTLWDVIIAVEKPSVKSSQTKYHAPRNLGVLLQLKTHWWLLENKRKLHFLQIVIYSLISNLWEQTIVDGQECCSPLPLVTSTVQWILLDVDVG